MSDIGHHLAGGAHQSTRDTVKVFSSDKRELEPCVVTKARRLVLKGKASWKEKDYSITLTSGQRQTLNESWDWEGRDSALYGRGDEQRRIFFPPEEKRFVCSPEGYLLKEIKAQIFHRAGRDGKVGSYSCTWDELAFLIETFSVEHREDGWWLVYCPGNYKFMRRTNGRA